MFDQNMNRDSSGQQYGHLIKIEAGLWLIFWEPTDFNFDYCSFQFLKYMTMEHPRIPALFSIYPMIEQNIVVPKCLRKM